MTVAWIAAGAAVLGAGASYAGSKKQADASKKGAKLQMDQFNVLNRQQQPFIQSGYGAMGRLNTLLGLGSRPRAPMSSAPMPSSPGGQGMGPPPQLQVGTGGAPPMMGNHMIRPPARAVSSDGMPPGMSPRLAQLLMLRAQNGDTEAQRMLG